MNSADDLFMLGFMGYIIDMYDAIGSGRIKSTLGTLPGTLKKREGKTAEKSRNYVLNRLEKGAEGSWASGVVADY